MDHNGRVVFGVTKVGRKTSSSFPSASTITTTTAFITVVPSPTTTPRRNPWRNNHHEEGRFVVDSRTATTASSSSSLAVTMGISTWRHRKSDSAAVTASTRDPNPWYSFDRRKRRICGSSSKRQSPLLFSSSSSAVATIKSNETSSSSSSILWNETTTSTAADGSWDQHPLEEQVVDQLQSTHSGIRNTDAHHDQDHCADDDEEDEEAIWTTTMEDAHVTLSSSSSSSSSALFNNTSTTTTIKDDTLLVPPAMTTSSSSSVLSNYVFNDDNTNNNNDRTTTVAVLPHSQPQTSHDIAVLLNRNARGVTTDIIDLAQDVFGTNAVYVTSTLAEAQSVAHRIMNAQPQQPKILVPIGGDGTLTTLIQSLCDAVVVVPTTTTNNNNITIMDDSSTSVSLAQKIRQLPLLAYIPLGTGNAVGSVVGCRTKQRLNNGSGWRRMLQRLLRRPRQRRLDHIRAVFEQIKEATTTMATANEENASVVAPPPFLSLSKSFCNVVELPILEVTTRRNSRVTCGATTTIDDSALCFFAGVGFDSLMLNDFKQIKAWSERTGILRQTLSSVAGYCVALIVKTLPSTITKSSHKVQVRVSTCTPHNTLWVDHRRGDFVQRIMPTMSTASKAASSTTRLPFHNNGNDDVRLEPNGSCSSNSNSVESTTVLFEGEAGILAAGTAPYYGGGLRLFPFARMTLDKMHLRLGRIHPATGFVNIPAIFAGSYRDKSNRFGVLDFLGTDFTVDILPSTTTNGTTNDDNSGFPLQHSGESIGNVNSFRLRVVEEPIRFLTL